MDEVRSLSDKLSGRYRHPEDAGGKRTLTGRLLRSPYERGRIVSLDIPEKPDGIVSIVNRDIPGNGKVTFGGASMPILSGKRVLWPGQPILAAAGPDEKELNDWLSGIVINFDEDGKGIPKEQIRSMNKGNPREAFSRAFQVVEESISIPAGKPSGSARTVVCMRDGNTYVIHTATSWPGAVRRGVSRVLKADRSNIRVRPYPIGPGPDRQTWLPAVEACRAALLSWKAKKSVKLSTSATESSLWDPVVPAVDFNIRGAVDGEGRVLAMEISFTMHSCAVFPLEEEFVNRLIMGLFSVYPCRNYSVKGHVVRDAGAPSGHGPAMGFELGFLAGELFASRVAEHSLIPPGSWRRENFPVSGQAFGPGLTLPRDFPMPTILGRALGISDFERKNASFEQTRLRRQNLELQPEEYRGIGLSCAWFGNGFVASPKELGQASVGITLDKDGILSVNIPSHTIGGALQRAWCMLAGEILGIDAEKSIRFAVELPGEKSDPGPSILGRNVSVYTRLIEQACNDLAKRRFRDALPISVSRTRRRSARQPWVPETFEGSPFETISWGAGIVEVAVSMRTGGVRPTRVWLVVDGGTLLMPDHARSAVESSAENALKWCLGLETGEIAPLMDIQFHETQSRRSSKDVSTLPWLLLPGACIQAVRQASGSDIHSIPMTHGTVIPGGIC